MHQARALGRIGQLVFVAVMVLSGCNKVPNALPVATRPSQAVEAIAGELDELDFPVEQSDLPMEPEALPATGDVAAEPASVDSNAYAATIAPVGIVFAPLRAEVTAVKSGTFLGMGIIKVTVTVTNASFLQQSGTVRVTFTKGQNQPTAEVRTVAVTIPGGQARAFEFSAPSSATNGAVATVTTDARGNVPTPAPTATPTAPTTGSLAGLRAAHPRLYWSDAEVEATRAALKRDPLLAQWHARLVSDANAMLATSPVTYPAGGNGTLTVAREALNRIGTLAGMYRLNGDARYLNRARRELLAIAAFPEWHPAHFLDVAEMTHAAALGYDWLYPQLTQSERTTVRQAIEKLGLKPGLAVFQAGNSWTTVLHNWNIVCSSGLAIGALAIGDESPELAGSIVRYAAATVRRPMAGYGPDGGWPEGPGYWNYATAYAAYMMAAMDSALGHDFGLSATPGFSETGDFQRQTTGPSGRAFNFGDSYERVGAAAQMLWLAKRYARPQDALDERARLPRPGIFHLVWGTQATGAGAPATPLDARFKGVDVATFRGAWDNPKAAYLAFKGGDSTANHAHLDHGNFIFDANGQRWAVDAGQESYSLPGYFSTQRWTYYNTRTEGHNTLSVDLGNQVVKAKSPIVSFRAGGDWPMAVADLSAAYGQPAGRVRRGVALDARARAVIQDEVTPTKTLNVVWHWHTRAAVTVDGQRATLSQGGQQLELRLLGLPNARFELLAPTASAPYGPPTGLKDLVVRVTAPAGKTTRWTVWAAPVGSKPFTHALTSLDSW